MTHCEGVARVDPLFQVALCAGKGGPAAEVKSSAGEGGLPPLTSCLPLRQCWFPLSWAPSAVPDTQGTSFALSCTEAMLLII